ncbi:MAG: helix-turn-helix transcriptional regulator [Spirochaetales bacterium]|nr:helix-turn-helix transcriptional regulator [Spirochaetales bacterium]
MTNSEFEIVSYPKLRHINIFLNQIRYRNLHVHNEIEIMYIVNGTGIVRCGGDNLVVKQGSVILFNSNDAHEINTSRSNLTSIIIQISKNFLQDYFPSLKTIVFEKNEINTSIDDVERKKLSQIIKDASLCYILADELYELETIEYISKILRLLLKNIPYVLYSEQDYLTKKRNIQRMNRIFSYIDNNYNCSIRLQDVADQENITTSHLSHIFSDTFGISFQDYLNNLRFEHAVRLISSSSKNLSEIAIESGFSDPKYMTKMFQKKFECTPKEFKQKFLDLYENIQQPLQNHSILEYYYTDKESIEILDDLNLSE